ncbi:MAG TPA: hypothetical protein VFA12_08915 [Stellaceae bacterium]|nr:hypothetical protein [Stellaceae bacterium]
MMKTTHLFAAAAVAAAVALSAHGALAELTGANRKAFVESSINSCSSAIKQAHPEVPADKVTTYCTCMAEAEADMTTEEDVQYMATHNAATPDYTRRVQALAPACNKKAGLQ